MNNEIDDFLDRTKELPHPSRVPEVREYKCKVHNFAEPYLRKEVKECNNCFDDLMTYIECCHTTQFHMGELVWEGSRILRTLRSLFRA